MFAQSAGWTFTVPAPVMGRARAALLAGALIALASWGAPASAKDRPANSKLEPRMSDPNDPSRFRFTFRSDMDRVGLGPDPDLFVYLNVLRVDGHSRRAVMVENRVGGDIPDRPVGLFATTLTKEQVAALGAAVEGIKWNELPELKGADISAATLAVDYSRGTKIIQRAFNARNWDFLKAIAPVMSQVTDLMNLVRAHPARALHVAVARTDSGFKLILRNVGTGPVIIADPRLPGSAPPATRGAVRVAPVRPPVPLGSFSYPPPMTPVPLAPLGHAPALVTLAAGKSLEVETLSWSAPAPGKYLAEGTWEDYQGPDVNPKTVMPTIPDPDQAATDVLPYLIRGAAVSNGVPFTIEKGR